MYYSNHQSYYWREHLSLYSTGVFRNTSSGRNWKNSVSLTASCSHNTKVTDKFLTTQLSMSAHATKLLEVATPVLTYYCVIATIWPVKIGSNFCFCYRQYCICLTIIRFDVVLSITEFDPVSKSDVSQRLSMDLQFILNCLVW